jgi:hypothetical protein
MNFEQLMQKMKDIDEGQSLPIAPTKDDQPGEAGAGASDEGVEECGMMPMPSMPPKQPDNVDMNVTMHGQGPGGIKDLMQILRNIESSDNKDPHSHDVDALFGGPKVGGAMDIVVDDGYENSPEGGSGPETFDIDTVVNAGTPINAGDHRPRQAGLPQGNPMQEALVSRLTQMYDEIKEGDQKTMSRAAKGHEKYGKEGMQALAKAGREGKDLDKVRDKYNKYD